VVLVEAPVLGGDQRIDHVRRDLAQRHPLAVHAPEFGQHNAVGRQHHRRRFRLGLAQVAGAGRERDQQQQVGQQQRRQRQRGTHGMAADRGDAAARQLGGALDDALDSRIHAWSLGPQRPTGRRTATTQRSAM
jgi:hypothetical protein